MTPRLEEVTAEIQEKQTASANMGTFLNAFEQMPDSLTEFSLESWHSMVDFATVYSIDDIDVHLHERLAEHLVLPVDYSLIRSSQKHTPPPGKTEGYVFWLLWF